MKRENNLLEKIADPENLRLAFWKAQKGKINSFSVRNYRNNLDKNLWALRDEILEGNVSVGKYRTFQIYDPKERTICAAAFRERVLHHAIINVCHSNFEQYQIFDSYACRLGKGTYAALDRAQGFQNKYRWFLKLDARKYFASIDKAILKSLLSRRYKEQKLLQIFYQIIDAHSPNSAKGVPIGNLTSQYFANHYLSAADHYLKENLGNQAYVRYMDDMVLWSNDKEKLLEMGNKFNEYVSDNLLLTLKPFVFNFCKEGLPFLGYLIYPRQIQLLRASKQRLKNKLNYYTDKLENGNWGEQEYQRHILPLFAFALHSNSYALRKRILTKENAPTV